MSEKYITYRAERNVYQIKVNVRIPNGDGFKVKAITKQSKTLEQAIRIRNELMRIYKLDPNLLSDRCRAKSSGERGKGNISEQIVDWYEDKKHFLELQTQRRYNSIIYRVILPIVNHRTPSEITQGMVQQMIFSLHENGYLGGTKKSMAVSSLRIVVLLLQQFYRDTFPDLPNPAKGIKYPREVKQRRESLTDAEVNAILAHIKKYDTDKYFLLKMYFETGCRRGELLALSWDDINFAAHTIHVHKTIINNPYTHKWEVKLSPKNDASIRYIFISENNMNYLRYMYQRAKKNQYPNEFVFVNRLKNPYNPKKITACFKNACRAVGIVKNVTLHSTRHTFASKLINEGAPIPVVQAIGGWGKPNTLLSVYAHSQEEVQKEVMQRIIFQSPGKERSSLTDDI